MIDLQKPQNFREAVNLMRVYQRAFFRTRMRTEQHKAMHYEKIVDAWLKRWQEEKKTGEPMVQQSLLLGGDLAWQMHVENKETK